MEKKDALLDAIKKMQPLLRALSKKITHNGSAEFIAEVFLVDLELDLFSWDMQGFSK